MGIFRRRAPVRVEDLEGLVEDGIRLSRAGAYREAERVLTRAVAQLAAAPVDDLAARRLLVKARWRLSMVMHAAGRPVEALVPGAAGIEVGRQLLAEATLSRRAELAAEVGTAAVDLAEASFAAGRTVSGPLAAAYELWAFGLLEEAIGWTGGFTEADREARKVYGTALHNRTTALVNQLVAGTGPAGGPEEVLRAATEALRARDRLRLDSDRLSVWELANTRLLHVRVAALAGQLPVAVAGLSDATALLPSLGPAAADLDRQAGALAAMLADLDPAAVARQRRLGPWPV